MLFPIVTLPIFFSLKLILSTIEKLMHLSNKQLQAAPSHQPEKLSHKLDRKRVCKLVVDMGEGSFVDEKRHIQHNQEYFEGRWRFQEETPRWQRE